MGVWLRYLPQSEIVGTVVIGLSTVLGFTVSLGVQKQAGDHTDFPCTNGPRREVPYLRSNDILGAPPSKQQYFGETLSTQLFEAVWLRQLHEVALGESSIWVGRKYHSCWNVRQIGP